MNMKKTIAALAAGAVAVSAMATTVSALEDFTFNYNLTTDSAWAGTYTSGTATVKFTVYAKATTEEVETAAATYKWTNADGETTDAAAPTAANATLTYYAVADATQQGAFIWADSDTATTATTANLSAAAPTADTDTLVFTAAVDTPAETEEVTTYEYPEYIKCDLSSNNYSMTKATVKITNAEVAEQSIYHTYDVSTHNNIDGTKITFGSEFDNYTEDVIIEVTAEYDVYGATEADVKAALKGNKYTIDAGDGFEYTTPALEGHKAAVSAGANVICPFKTTLKAKDATEILSFLSTVKGYPNVLPVLNDAIENYDSVTFTFNTATAPIGYVVKDYVEQWDGTMATKYEDEYVFIDYNAALAAAKGVEDDVIAVYTTKEGATKEYMGFAQHLYTGLYDPENTKYVGYDWEGFNLFGGALIVNEAWTMSLSETQYFDYTGTSLSFDWDAIMDYAATQNDYARYLHTLRLATSNRWYWDSLDVVCLVGDADNAGAGAGTEGGGTDVPETPEDPDSNETVDLPEDPEPAPAPDVTNPTTGNASVALAVIPVALAAAAVVAKKRS